MKDKKMKVIRTMFLIKVIKVPHLLVIKKGQLRVEKEFY